MSGAHPAGGRSVSVSVSPHPAPARPITANSAAARSVRGMGIEGIHSPVVRLSEDEQHFGGGAPVHRLVARRRLVQREGEVEDPAGVDRAVPDEPDRLGQVSPDGAGPPWRWTLAMNSGTHLAGNESPSINTAWPEPAAGT